jgi:hypothetical protein
LQHSIVQVAGNSGTFSCAFLETDSHLPERWLQTKEIGASIRKRQSIEHDSSSFLPVKAVGPAFFPSPAGDPSAA